MDKKAQAKRQPALKKNYFYSASIAESRLNAADFRKPLHSPYVRVPGICRRGFEEVVRHIAAVVGAEDYFVSAAFKALVLKLHKLAHYLYHRHPPFQVPGFVKTAVGVDLRAAKVRDVYSLPEGVEHLRNVVVQARA